MAYTNKFRAQHGELLNVVKSIVQLLDANSLRNDAKEVRHLLSVLHGKLSVHLAMEDKSLYPRLLRHHDSDIRATTQRYIDEMGSLAGWVLEADQGQGLVDNSTGPDQARPDGDRVAGFGRLDRLVQIREVTAFATDCRWPICHICRLRMRRRRRKVAGPARDLRFLMGSFAFRAPGSQVAEPQFQRFQSLFQSAQLLFELCAEPQQVLSHLCQVFGDRFVVALFGSILTQTRRWRDQ